MRSMSGAELRCGVRLSSSSSKKPEPHAQRVVLKNSSLTRDKVGRLLQYVPAIFIAGRGLN
jgi:hypothetical protein